MDYWSEDFDNSDWRVNKLLETEVVFDNNEVAAEMHISLVRYEQETQIASLQVFSVTRRSRSDSRHSLTYWVSVSIDLSDMTLVSDDTYWRLDWCYSSN